MQLKSTILGGLAVRVGWYFTYNPALMQSRNRALYRELIGPGDLAFDVGAHVGTRARAMRHYGARVIAFETAAGLCAFPALGLAARYRAG